MDGVACWHMIRMIGFVALVVYGIVIGMHK